MSHTLQQQQSSETSSLELTQNHTTTSSIDRQESSATPTSTQTQPSSRSEFGTKAESELSFLEKNYGELTKSNPLKSSTDNNLLSSNNEEQQESLSKETNTLVQQIETNENNNIDKSLSVSKLFSVYFIFECTQKRGICCVSRSPLFFFLLL
jgi:hypothetical protein